MLVFSWSCKQHVDHGFSWVPTQREFYYFKRGMFQNFIRHPAHWAKINIFSKNSTLKISISQLQIHIFHKKSHFRILISTKITFSKYTILLNFWIKSGDLLQCCLSTFEYVILEQGLTNMKHPLNGGYVFKDERLWQIFGCLQTLLESLRIPDYWPFYDVHSCLLVKTSALFHVCLTPH